MHASRELAVNLAGTWHYVVKRRPKPVNRSSPRRSLPGETGRLRIPWRAKAPFSFLFRLRSGARFCSLFPWRRSAMAITRAVDGEAFEVTPATLKPLTDTFKQFKDRKIPVPVPSGTHFQVDGK